MEYSRFLDCLAADFARLRAVVPTDPTAAVPSCPGWTVADLTRYLGEVYLHKTLAMREGAEPDPWPPHRPAGASPRNCRVGRLNAWRAPGARAHRRDPAGRCVPADRQPARVGPVRIGGTPATDRQRS